MCRCRSDNHEFDDDVCIDSAGYAVTAASASAAATTWMDLPAATSAVAKPTAMQHTAMLLLVDRILSGRLPLLLAIVFVMFCRDDDDDIH